MKEYRRHLELYKAVDRGNWEATKAYLKRNPDAITASLTSDDDTALHIGVLAGHEKIIEELVKRTAREDLLKKNKNNATALNFAATGGVVTIAERLVKKNSELLKIRNQHDYLPVVVASLNGHRDMVRYLYSVTSLDELSPQKGKNGVMLFTNCIVDDLYGVLWRFLIWSLCFGNILILCRIVDIALDMLKCYKELAFAVDVDGDTALDMLAQKPSAFPSGTNLALWRRWIYSCT